MESRPHPSPARRYVPVVVALLGVVAVALIASAVNIQVTRTNDSGGNPRPVTQPQAPTLPAPNPSAPVPTAPAGPVPASVGSLLRILILLVVLALVVLVVVAARRIVRDVRDRRREELFPSGPEVPASAGAADNDRVVAAVASGLGELADDRDPRGSVIAAWLRLEAAAEQIGRVRRPGDTPTDLVTGLLADRQVPPEDLARFAEIYLAARYSRRDVDQSMRADALTALGRVEESLRPDPAAVERDASAGVGAADVDQTDPQ